jgi:hypothetical protein
MLDDALENSVDVQAAIYSDRKIIDYSYLVKELNRKCVPVRQPVIPVRHHIGIAV